MYRHLMAMHVASGGTLLQERRGPRGKKRYTVAIDALKGLVPSWFPEHGAEEVAALRADVDRVIRTVDLIVTQVGAIARKVG